jgi:hypothetical protein
MQRRIYRPASYLLTLATAASGAQAQLSDPVIAALEQHIFASNGQQTDNLGSSVAVSADTCVAGAPGHDPAGVQNAGGAWVFVFGGASWSQEALLLASDGQASDSFGNAVAVDGETIVVGASSDDHPGNGNAGSAYVFVRSGTVWTEQAKLVGSFVTTADAFGTAVAIAGDRIAVGSPADESPTSGASRGLVYVFERSGTTWTETAVLQASDGEAGERFGESVALAGSTLAVGAENDDDLGSLSGSAYVFVHSGSAWTEQAELHASDGAMGDRFGASIAAFGEHVLVGAPYHDGAAADTGAAYAFGRNGTIWTEQAELEPVLSINGNTGRSLALSADFALVGVPNDPIPGSTGAGSAFLYRRTNASWTLETKVTHDLGHPSGHFGESVSLSGAALAIGAPDDSFGLLAGQGSAYAFRLTSTPEIYCTAKTNSLGCQVQIGFSGVPSASSASPFLVTAVNVLDGKNGLLFYGYGLENNTFQGGYLCVQKPIKRTAVQDSGGTPPASCTGSYSYDFNARIQSGVDPQLLLGADVYCQYWSRDPALGTAFPVNLSDALHFAIQP